MTIRRKADSASCFVTRHAARMPATPRRSRSQRSDAAMNRAHILRIAEEVLVAQPRATMAELAAAANVTAQAYEQAREDRVGFWETQARRLTWATEWDTALTWDTPDARWFDGGELNVAVNCLDRHLAERGDAVARQAAVGLDLRLTGAARTHAAAAATGATTLP